MKTFLQDLDEAVAYHGHLCAGQITGVRMARMALRLLEIDDPKTFRDLIVYVESDRCLTDSIGTVTCCKLGKRSLKWMDYGKAAATFLNIATDEAIRIRRKAYEQVPEGADLIEFFAGFTDDEMFSVTPVKVHYRPEDLPGRPLEAMICPKCSEEVIDGRQTTRDGVSLCRACADGAYYQEIAEIE